jgi:DNA-binding transcriptional LysR family regulator
MEGCSIMDLNTLRMFVAVVKAGSLSAAAERIDVPLATLSRRIRDLEAQINVQLIERSRQGTHLTDEGSRLYDYAVRGLETLEEGEQAIKNSQAKLNGRLRVSIPPSFSAWWDLLGDFQRTYPDIELQVYVTERRMDLIREGVDVALRVGDIGDDTMVARKLASYRHMLVASPKLIKLHGIPVEVDDLYRFPCAVWVAPFANTPNWKLGEKVFKPSPLLTTNDYFQLRNRAVAGDFITELPPFIAAPMIADGSLAPLLPKQPLPEYSINLLYPVHRHPSTIIRTYLDFCKNSANRYLGDFS